MPSEGVTHSTCIQVPDVLSSSGCDGVFCLLHVQSRDDTDSCEWLTTAWTVFSLPLLVSVATLRPSSFSSSFSFSSFFSFSFSFPFSFFFSFSFSERICGTDAAGVEVEVDVIDHLCNINTFGRNWTIKVLVCVLNAISSIFSNASRGAGIVGDGNTARLIISPILEDFFSSLGLDLSSEIDVLFTLLGRRHSDSYEYFVKILFIMHTL